VTWACAAKEKVMARKKADTDKAGRNMDHSWWLSNR